jgi:Ca-activated chloride channel family protein
MPEILPVSFGRPILLIALVLPILLIYWQGRWANHRVSLPADATLIPRRKWLGRLLAISDSLPALILAVVIVILAGPQRLSIPQARRAMTNIELCVDVSGSMLAPFGSGTRYDGSMDAINSFLDKRQGDAVGLTFFGNNVLHWVPLTNDISAIRHAAPFMSPDKAPPWMGGTEIGKALMACRELLVTREEGDRLIILISDGASFDLDNGRDEEIARLLKRDNITVYSIHIAGGDVPEEIINITHYTGGEAFQPGNPESLKAMFTRIDSMNRAKLVQTSAQVLDAFGPWCVSGLSVLGLATIAAMGLRYSPW